MYFLILSLDRHVATTNEGSIVETIVKMVWQSLHLIQNLNREEIVEFEKRTAWKFIFQTNCYE